MVIMEKSVVKKEDYEIYNLHLPWRILLEGRQKQFIYSELEKRHPGFSEDWSYNTKYGIGKKGIESRILVMNKVKYAQYKAVSGFKSLHFDNAEKNAISKWKLNGFSKQILIVVFLILLVACAYFVREKLDKSRSDLVNSEISENIFEPLPVNQMKVINFFESCIKAGGKVKKFSWVSDGNHEYFEAYVSSVFPEELIDGNLNIEAITFEKEIPNYVVSFVDNVRVSENKIWGEEENCEEIFSTLRNCIKESGMSLVEENHSACSVKARCSDYGIELHRKFWFAIDDCFSNSNIAVMKVNFNKEDGKNSTEEAFIEIGFSKNLSYDRGLDIGILKSNEELFAREKSVAIKPVLKKNSSQNPKGIKVGEVKHPDGTISVFYKNEKGKIICVN